MPVGAPSFREALRWGTETYHTLKKVLHDRRLVDRRRRRGRLRSRPRLERGRDPAARRGDRAAGYTPGEDIAIALDPAMSELFKDGRYHLAGEGKVLSPDEMVGLLDPPGRHVPDRVDRGRHGRGRLGRLGSPVERPARTRAARRRRPVRHQRRPPPDGHRPQGRQQRPGQGQPDRHAHRDARHRRAGDRATATPA